MELVGYARVSSIDQNWDTQINALNAAGCVKVFMEKKSGTTLSERSTLEECIAYLRAGDTLVVTRIDRLTRSILDLQMLLVKLKKKKAHLKATEQPIDTNSASGKAFLDMLGVFAEFETNLRRERQLEGVARAKKEGKYRGRKPTAKAKAPTVINLTNQGFTRQAVADQLNMGIASVFRILKQYKIDNPEVVPENYTKIAVVEVNLIIENNSKFVRGKNKSREEIELSCFSYYDMKKKGKDSNDYILEIPYVTDKELDDTISELISEASSIADDRDGFIEMYVMEPLTGKTWD